MSVSNKQWKLIQQNINRHTRFVARAMFARDSAAKDRLGWLKAVADFLDDVGHQMSQELNYDSYSLKKKPESHVLYVPYQIIDMLNESVATFVTAAIDAWFDRRAAVR